MKHQTLTKNLIICCLLFMLSAVHARADRRVALVVGNSDYSSAPALANPTNDATAIGAALERLGFSVSLGLDQTNSEFRDLIYQFSRQAEGAELALFFYAGHGIQVAGRNYLLPVDATVESETDLDFAAVDLQLVLKQLERSARNSIVLPDACRDNPFETALSRSMGATRSATALSRGLARVETLGGALIGFATDPGAVAFDGDGQHSPFTDALLSHMETPGLEINSLMTRVRADVVTATDRRQRPWATSSLLQEVRLAPEAQPAADVTPQLVATAADGQGVPPNPANAWEKFQERFDGTSGNDVIFGGAGVDWFRATPGNDFYSGGAEWNQYNIIIPDIALDDLRWSYDKAAKMLRSVHPALGTDYFDASIDNFWSATPDGGEWRGLESLIAIAEPFTYHPRDVGRPAEERLAAVAPLPATRDPIKPGDTSDPGAVAFQSIPAGRFTMGSNANATERPLIEVDLPGFFISQSEITVGQYRQFIAQSGYTPEIGCYVWTDNGRLRFRDQAGWASPGFDVSDDMPVACINWHDAQAYTVWFSSTYGKNARLPSEAELEYVIRAGTTGEYPFSGGAEGACKAVNAADASSRFKWRNTACQDGFAQVAEVSALTPNAFGLTGTTGNLWEWAADCWNPSHKGAPNDASARTTGQCESRVLRGGSWDDPLENLRSAYRVGISSKQRQANIGFRIVLEN